jgi:hypothetical protein
MIDHGAEAVVVVRPMPEETIHVYKRLPAFSQSGRLLCFRRDLLNDDW